MPQCIKTDPITWSSPTPTEPVIISRVPVYAPVSRPATKGKRSAPGGRFETPWGWVEISEAVLTWKHRRILLLSKTSAKAEKLWEDGSLSLWIDAYEVKKELGYKGGSGHNRFLQRLRDMKTSNLKIYNNRTKRMTESSVIWSFSYDKGKPDTPAKPGIFTKTRRPKMEKGVAEEEAFLAPSLFEIRISKEYMSLFGEDLRIHHSPDLIREFVKIGDGMIATVVAFFLSHKEGCRYKISRVLEIIEAIRPEMTKGRISQMIKKVRMDKEILERFGIGIEGECLVYDRNNRVFFTNPPPPPPKASTVEGIGAELGAEPTSPRTALETTMDGVV